MYTYKSFSEVLADVSPEEYKAFITKMAKELSVVVIPKVLYETENLVDIEANYRIVQNYCDLTSSGTGQFTGGYYEEEYEGIGVTYVFGFDNGDLCSYKVIRSKSNATT